LPRPLVHIRTVGHVLQELSKQYRRAERGELTWHDCAAASRVLREIRQTIEGGELEQRLRRLEEAAGDDPDHDWPSLSGADRHVPVQ